MKAINFIFSRRRQGGAVLIISMMLLLVMTLVGVTALQTTSLEEKMSGNTRDRDLAFQAAEVALRAGEDYLGNVALPNFDNTNGHYEPDAYLWKTVDWSDSSKVTVVTDLDDAVNDDVLSSAPRYYLEELAETITPGDSLVVGFTPSPVTGNYRVTALGYGGSAYAEVILQTTFRR